MADETDEELTSEAVTDAPPRPTAYEQAIADHICEQLADGKSLRRICAEPAMPSKAAVFRWLGANDDFADQYARARESQADSHADDIIDIADDKKLDPNDKRVRIDARKWLAGKQRPKKYGDKLAVDASLTGRLHHEHSADDTFAAVAAALGGNAARPALGPLDDGGMEGESAA